MRSNGHPENASCFLLCIGKLCQLLGWVRINFFSALGGGYDLISLVVWNSFGNPLSANNCTDS